MLRSLRLAIAGISVAAVVAVAGIASGVTGGDTVHKVVVQPAPVNVAAVRPTIPTTVAPDTTTTATTVPPTTAPRRIVAPATTAAPRVVATVPQTAAPRVIIPAPAVVHSTPVGSGGSAGDFVVVGYRWNPCHVVTVNSTGPDVSGIVSELASITGLRLQMVPGVAEINVQWGAVPAGGEIGLTAWRAVGGWLSTAGVVISPQAQPYLATVLRHELGHALGLGHAAHPDEVMYPSVGHSSPTDYQAGDIAGLHAIGASAGC
jgi:hypothetical protein